MIVEERLPALRRGIWPPHHVLGNRGLRDLDAKLEQFAVNRGGRECFLDSSFGSVREFPLEHWAYPFLHDELSKSNTNEILADATR